MQDDKDSMTIGVFVSIYMIHIIINIIIHEQLLPFKVTLTVCTVAHIAFLVGYAKSHTCCKMYIPM